MIITCIMSLMITPVSAESASNNTFEANNVTYASPSSTPVLITDETCYKFYGYLPDALSLSAGNSTMLLNIAEPDGAFYVPGGYRGDFQCILPGGGLVEVSVYKFDYGLVSRQIINVDDIIQGFIYQFPTSSVTSKYHVAIKAITNLNVSGYGGEWY